MDAGCSEGVPEGNADAGSQEEVPEHPPLIFQKAKTMNCGNCFYKQINQDGGHCYMFKEPPTGYCAQFILSLVQIKKTK
jgi:hypothetical protein